MVAYHRGMGRSTETRPPASHPRVGRLVANVGFLASRFTYFAARAASDVLEPYGLNIRSFTALELAAGDHGSSQRSLGRVLCLDPSNVVRLIDDLEERGLVLRVRDPADRRRTIIAATSTGRDVAERTATAVERAYEDLLSPLYDDDRGTMMALLERVALADLDDDS